MCLVERPQHHTVAHPSHPLQPLTDVGESCSYGALPPCKDAPTERGGYNLALPRLRDYHPLAIPREMSRRADGRR